MALGIVLLVATLQIWPPPSAPKIAESSNAKQGAAASQTSSPGVPAEAAQSPEEASAEEPRINEAARDFAVLGYNVTLTADKHFLIVVFLVGALSSIAMLLRSLAVHHGKEDFKATWVPYYLLTPLTAGIAALMVVLVFLGGLFGASISVAPENPYGLVAVAAIVGMFIKETLEKLKTIAAALFQEVATGEQVGGSQQRPTRNQKERSEPGSES